MVRRNSTTSGPEGAINRQLNIPPGMIFLSRINFGLAGIFGRLNAHGRWRAIIGEYIYGTEPTSDLGRLSAASTRGPSV